MEEDKGTDLGSVYISEADQKSGINNEKIDLNVYEEEDNIKKYLSDVGIPMAQSRNEDQLRNILLSINKWCAYQTVLLASCFVGIITIMFMVAAILN